MAAQQPKQNGFHLNSLTSYDTSKCDDPEPATFEDAIKATGFGKFNIFLMLVIMPAAFSQVFETVTMSYVLPIAQCDLNLSLEDKGMLNAITFVGMLTTGFFWGYLCDATGRKQIMVYGYLLEAFFVVMSSFSQSFTMLLIAKFFGGAVINGPFSAATSYLSEFHCSQYRARVHLVRGIIVSLATIILPLLAWAILPQNLNFTLFNCIDMHSWNIFLLACSLPSVASGVIFLFMPESPKFLMSSGKNEEALRVLEKIYSINTGRSVESYPIKKLVDETVQSKIEVNKEQTSKAMLMEGLYQIKTLFCPPNISKLLLACSNGFLAITSTNTLKLWFPQLFQAINDYESTHGSSSSICNMLELLNGKNTNSSSCVVNLHNSSVYINSIIVGATQILVFAIAGTLVNLLGKKTLVVVMAVISGCCSSCIYFAPNSETVLALSAVFLSFAGVCVNVLVTITLEMFPTTLRAMALSLHFMSARSGSVVGNMVFPSLLHAGCAPPFLFIGLVISGTAGLTLLYPNTENKPLV